LSRNIECCDSQKGLQQEKGAFKAPPSRRFANEEDNSRPSKEEGHKRLGRIARFGIQLNIGTKGTKRSLSPNRGPDGLKHGQESRLKRKKTYEKASAYPAGGRGEGSFAEQKSTRLSERKRVSPIKKLQTREGREIDVEAT